MPWRSDRPASCGRHPEGGAPRDTRSRAAGQASLIETFCSLNSLYSNALAAMSGAMETSGRPRAGLGVGTSSLCFMRETITVSSASTAWASASSGVSPKVTASSKSGNVTNQVSLSSFCRTAGYRSTTTSCSSFLNRWSSPPTRSQPNCYSHTITDPLAFVDREIHKPAPEQLAGTRVRRRDEPRQGDRGRPGAGRPAGRH